MSRFAARMAMEAILTERNEIWRSSDAALASRDELSQDEYSCHCSYESGLSLIHPYRLRRRLIATARLEFSFSRSAWVTGPGAKRTMGSRPAELCAWVEFELHVVFFSPVAKSGRASGSC
jgi:hypothetical protein